jgi:hypothetical protein
MRAVHSIAWFLLTPAVASAIDEILFPGGWEADLPASQYRIGLDREARHGGKFAAFLEPRSARLESPEYGSLVQTISARNFRGKRMKFSAFVKTERLKGKAQLWTLVWHSSPDSSNREVATPIENDSDWARQEVEFSVADDAVTIECGLMLIGRGRVRMDDASLDVVKADGTADGNTKTAQAANVAGPPSEMPSRMENGDFEQSKLEYDLALAQGLWELEDAKSEIPATPRVTRRIAGKKATTTSYDNAGRVSSEYTSPVVSRSSRIGTGERQGEYPKDRKRSRVFRPRICTL